eukprot:6190054-Prymnesium_polylepis.1
MTREADTVTRPLKPSTGRKHNTSAALSLCGRRVDESIRTFIERWTAGAGQPRADPTEHRRNPPM